MRKRGEELILMENITENKNYSDELVDPFEMDFFKEFKKEDIKLNIVYLETHPHLILRGIH